MGWLRQENAYERRLRELEEETERVRKNMQSLMKNNSRDSSSRTASPTGPRTRSSALPGQSYVPVEETPFVNESNEEIENNEPQETISASDPRRATYNQGEYNRSAAPGKPEKLASYLASGSFGKSGSLSHERRIQRNKAIFMLIVAILAIFSLISWLK